MPTTQVVSEPTATAMVGGGGGEGSNEFFRMVEARGRARAIGRGEPPAAVRVVCERCEAERLTLLIYQCGVMLCSTCFMLAFRNNNNGVRGELVACGQCSIAHEQIGLLLASTGTVRYWFGERKLVLLLTDLINRGYFWHDVPPWCQWGSWWRVKMCWWRPG